MGQYEYLVDMPKAQKKLFDRMKHKGRLKIAESTSVFQQLSERRYDPTTIKEDRAKLRDASSSTFSNGKKENHWNVRMKLNQIVVSVCTHTPPNTITGSDESTCQADPDNERCGRIRSKGAILC